jgi:hypothetical protein
VQNRRQVLLKLQREDPTAFLHLAQSLDLLVDSDSLSSPQAQQEEADQPPILPPGEAVLISPSSSLSRTPGPTSSLISIMAPSHDTDRSKYCAW